MTVIASIYCLVTQRLKRDNKNSEKRVDQRHAKQCIQLKFPPLHTKKKHKKSDPLHLLSSTFISIMLIR